MDGPRCLSASRGPKFSPQRIIFASIRLAKFVCTSSIRDFTALGLRTPISRRFRIVGGADHDLPGFIQPCPHRDLARREVIYTCTVASLAPLTRWSSGLFDPRSLLAALTT